MQVELFGLEARREARERVTHHGKFEGESPLTVILFNASVEGWYEDDCSVEGNWYSRLGRHILHEADNGFVSRTQFKTIDEAIVAFDDISKDLEGW